MGTARFGLSLPPRWLDPAEPRYGGEPRVRSPDTWVATEHRPTNVPKKAPVKSWRPRNKPNTQIAGREPSQALLWCWHTRNKLDLDCETRRAGQDSITFPAATSCRAKGAPDPPPLTPSSAICPNRFLVQRSAMRRASAGSGSNTT